MTRIIPRQLCETLSRQGRIQGQASLIGCWPATIQMRRHDAPVHDARIAAVCPHHRVSDLWTADRDFSRFSALTTRNPLV